MYLSRLILNPRSRRVQRELAEPYEMHRSLMRAFPDNLAPGAERVLFRVDQHPSLEVPLLLVQSLDAPDWSWLQDSGARDYLLSVADPNPAVKPFDPQLVVGQALAFRLRANPTAKKAHENQETGQGRRHALVREDDQRAWLDRKAVAGGFRVLTVTIAREDTTGGKIIRDGKRHDLCLSAVRFDGLLQVTDPAQFVATLRQGIGSGKGMGFGLLSLARANA